MAVINTDIALKVGARPASELADLARRALDAQLGIALQDQFAGPDPEADEAALVFGDFFALAARHGGKVMLDDSDRVRLSGEGRSPQHIHKLELLIRHNVGCQPLSDRHLAMRLDAMGLAFQAAQADSDRRVMLTAWSEAHYRAAQFHAGALPAGADLIGHLLGSSPLQRSPPFAAPGQADPPPTVGTAPSGQPTAHRPTPLLSAIIKQVIAGIVSSGSWKDGPGSTAEDAQRLLDQLCWMIGDLPTHQYGQHHLAVFYREMMAMPKTVRAKTVWHVPYVDAKKSFPPLTAANTRNVRTINKDLSILSTFAERMATEGYWVEGAIKPLKFACKVTAKQKSKAKPPWTIDNVQQMLGCPIYTGNGGPKNRLRPGDFLYQDAAYWLLPLAALSAGCQEELGGVLLDDIVFDTAIPFIVIRENHLRGLKRDARERVVPIHPQLLALGFQAYVDRLRRDGATELFPELWINAVKRGGDQYRQIVWYKLLDWLRGQGVSIPVGIKGKAADFHSIRSTVLSLLDRADINQNIVKDIAGHAREGVTAGTYQDLVASGGLDEALRERLIVLERLPDFLVGLSPCAVKLLPLNLRSR